MQQAAILRAADPNVLLLTILDHGAFRAIDEGNLDLVMTLHILKEVEHLPFLAEKADREAGAILENLAVLEAVAYGPKKYRRFLPVAMRRIEFRDPDDVPLLALDMTLDVSISTHDRDFKVAGVQSRAVV